MSEHQKVVAAKWISCLDVKFATMTSNGDLIVCEVLADYEDELADSIQVNKIHQIQTFEELNEFSFSDIDLIGNNSIEVCS